jgi:hypothetical protein
MKVSVFEYIELPENIKEALIEYYKGTDHREILNDSYSRYPYLCDFGYTESELDTYFLDNGSDWSEGHCLIHWEW